MSDTPKATKSRARPSLSLNKRLTKRLSSPHKRKTHTENSQAKVICFDSNDGTPPHKKLNLDDSYDSPTNFESNHSPTMFLSQTFCPDSPEVGWQWTQEMENKSKAKKSHTIDSGIASSASNSNSTLKRTQSQVYATRQDVKMRAEKIRSEAILRERLSKLEEQLTIASSSTKPVLELQEKPVEKSKNQKNSVESINLPAVTAESDTVDMADFTDFDNIFDESLTLETSFKFQAPAANTTAKPAAATEWDDLDDFFNDSDADSLLLAATQQIEAALPEAAPPKATVSVPVKTTPKHVRDNSVTPKSNKNKRSSLYMQFLEDDEDDLFVSLDDETVLKASQSLKTRSPFQRYKSMPAATTTATTTATNSTVLTSSGTKMPEYPNWSLKNGTHQRDKSTNGFNSNKAPIKRHVSSHAIATTTSNLHGLQLHRRH